MTQKVKLTGRPAKTATWIWLDDGELKVELYDFSETAQTLFGNDIAYTMTVKEVNKLYSIVDKDETTLIAWMAQYFKSYFGIKEWLEENGIEFSIERESWA
jgi:hypothetical protein